LPARDSIPPTYPPMPPQPMPRTRGAMSPLHRGLIMLRRCEIYPGGGQTEEASKQKRQWLSLVLHY
jgi:hypothetical protein